MIGTSQEEEKKDEILQQINDLLEKHNWGAGCQRLVVRLEFNGKFNLNSFPHIQRKERVDI